MIVCRGKNFDEAMTLLEQFCERYPAADIVRYSEEFEVASGPASLAPSTSFLYPETRDSSNTRSRTDTAAPTGPVARSGANSLSAGTPPHLTYHGMYSLYHAFRELEDPRDRRVTTLTDKYRRALIEGDEIRRLKAKKIETKKIKEARRRLTGPQRIPEEEKPQLLDAFKADTEMFRQ